MSKPLKCALRRGVDWSRVDKFAYLEATRISVADGAKWKALLKAALEADGLRRAVCPALVKRPIPP